MAWKSLAPRIAWRYLFSKKQHGAVGIITGVSMCGVAVATAAIVCVLSVFNGFQSIIIDKQEQLGCDVVITPEEGKILHNADSLLAVVTEIAQVKYAYPTLTDNALAYYDGKEMPVTMKGVLPDVYAQATAIKSLVKEDGEYRLSDLGEEAKKDSGLPVARNNRDGELSEEEILLEELEADEAGEKRYYALISPGVAIRLGVRPYDEQYDTDEFGFLLFAPRRLGQVNMANPGASFLKESLPVTGVFQTLQSDIDKDYVIVDIDVARRLLQYDSDAATSIEVMGKSGVQPQQLSTLIRGKLPDNVVVKDKIQQQEVNFHMISIEKWITFLLLAFILIVASFNIISSLSMLVIDKEKNLATLHAMGASGRVIGRIFYWESIFVTIIGALSGLILGIALCLIQQHFGLIKLSGDPGALVIDAYPVVVQVKDIIIVLIPVILIGLATASISSHFARTRINTDL
jgi:ABC-type lipoprotein release transport system permease subunit